MAEKANEKRISRPRKQKKVILKDVEAQEERGLKTRVTMTTNVNVDILAEAKAFAKDNQLPLSRVIDAALELYLNQEKNNEQMKMAL